MLITFLVIVSFLSCFHCRLGGEGDILLISGAPLLEPLYIFYSSVLPSLHPRQDSCPDASCPPFKDKNSFQAISITTAPKIKKQQKHLYNVLHCPAPFLLTSYDTLCMFSLTAVYLNQYIYQTAAAYCVCRFE